MGSSIKINSISIDLAGAANEIDMVKCDHFSIRAFVAETRERDHRKCWPFSEESISLVDQQNYALPSLSVPKFRWWHCMSCIKDIDADGTKDCGLHSNSRTIGNSSVIPSKSKLNSLTIIDQEKERKTDIAGNAVEENLDVNCERIQKDDQTATTFLKKGRGRPTNASIVRSKSRKLASPEQVGNKRSKEKVNKQDVDHQAVTTFGSSEIAGVVEDTPPKATKNHKGIRGGLLECDNGSSESINLAMSGLQRRKSRKVRLLSELLGNTKTSGGGSSNIRKEQSAFKKESVRGRKRKSLPENNYVSRILSTNGATSENASKSCDSDQGKSESTDSGFERTPIKGKQRNRRFQVVDEFVPPLPCETAQEGVKEHEADPSKRSTPVHSLFTGKDSVPCPPGTQRTEKKLSLAKKKTKKHVTDNGKSTLISFNTGIDGNQVISQTGPSVNIVSHTRDLLNEKSLFDNRLASEGYFRKYIPQPNDKPVTSLHLQDNDHVRLRDAEPNCLRDFSSSSKSSTGGWLRTGADVVDFRSNNNNNTNRPSFSNFKLRYAPSSTEVADVSRVLQKDASGADRKGKTVMVQEHDGAPRSQSHDRKETTTEEQNDDIPMEIVELMAKNQYERCLPDKEEDVSNKQPSQETAHKSKNALLIDLNETYDNGISLEDNNNTSRPPKPCGSSARREEHFPMGKQQQNSHDFFPISQPYVPSPFGIFPPTQENRASSIRFSGHNCQWLGNSPTVATQNPSPSSFRVLRACDTCQSVPNSHPIWPSSMIPPQSHHKPVSFNIDQSAKPGMLSQTANNENTWNLNFVAANGKQKCGTNSELSFGCKHAAGLSSSSSRPIDTFSSESSIPALHLLSLMNPRLRSTTPADQHGNTKFTKRHFPPVNNQSKEFIELQTGDSSKTTYSTKQLPFDFYNKRFAQDSSSRKSFPIIPPLGTSSFSFQNAQASWSPHHQEKKAKGKDTFAAPVYNNTNEKAAFASSNDQAKFQLLGASNSMMLPLKFHMTDKEKKQKRKAESCNNASAWPLKNSGPIVCSVNRNPADFTIPEPGNVYMLTAQNLKIRKRTTFKKKPSLCKQDAMKHTNKPVCPPTENA
ncbi:PREDICTED: protein EMBRYONIC FLOWER 1-like isoform X2 [Camelina sativa]|uniref:Protein EMBRYONIC FLOWER 1-like isoform X2 n=1 Tax=Camelina sativa TaxID=90675 RepID=A0ABM0VA43_CAMSA|nr:PREDICTED: protein EMBRYONIC FLOWER 1-like isoform X2 [Camelina sativa]